MTNQSTGRLRGFTWVELLVVLFIIAMLIGLLLPLLARSRRTARGPQYSTHLRGLHQGEIFFAQSNNRWFTGFDRDGKLETGHVFEGEPQSTDWNGYDQSTPRSPAWRFRRLL